MFAIILLPLVGCLFVGQSVAKVPSFIHVCGRRNPNLDECIKKSTLNVLTRLKVGIPELDVPGIDPLFVEQVDVLRSPRFSASAANLKVVGLSNADIEYLHYDRERLIFNITARFKNVDMYADYSVNSTIVIPITGKGPIHVHVDDYKTNVVMQFEFYDRKGVQYVRATAVEVTLFITDYQAHLEFTEGAKELTAAMNQVLNDREGGLLESTTPFLQKTIGERLLVLTNKLCGHFSYDELFPDRE